MNRRVEHPPNLMPLLDGSPADKEYQEIQQHVKSCAQCQGEFRIWESLDGLVRSPELEIEVPPFQWQRIHSGLTASQPATGWKRFLVLATSRRFALRATVATLVIVIVAMYGWQYYYKFDRMNLLKTLAAFSQSESIRLSAAKNPFSAFGESAIENPFDKFEAKISGKNPFAASWQND